MPTLVEQIKRYQPCDEAKDWLATQIDVESAWKNCERGDWMFWYLSKIGADNNKIILCSCEIARLALKYTDDPRVEQCIVVTEKYANGDPTVTIEDIIEARKAVCAIDASTHSTKDASLKMKEAVDTYSTALGTGDPCKISSAREAVATANAAYASAKAIAYANIASSSAYASAYAAYSTTNGVYDANVYAASATNAANAAYAAANSTGIFNANAARLETLKQCSDIVREYFPKVN